MHVPVLAMHGFRPREVEEVLEVGRQANQCQRSHAVRWHREVSAGDVHEDVDVAAVPAPEALKWPLSMRFSTSLDLIRKDRSPMPP